MDKFFFVAFIVGSAAFSNLSAEPMVEADAAAGALAQQARTQRPAVTLEELSSRFFPPKYGFYLKEKRSRIIYPPQPVVVGYDIVTSAEKWARWPEGFGVYVLPADDLNQLEKKLVAEFPPEKVGLLFHLIRAEEQFRNDVDMYRAKFGLGFEPEVDPDGGAKEVTLKIRPELQCFKGGARRSPGVEFKTTVHVKPFGAKFVKSKLKPYGYSKSNLYIGAELTSAVFLNDEVRAEYFALSKDIYEYCRDLSPRTEFPWAGNTLDALAKLWDREREYGEHIRKHL